MNWLLENWQTVAALAIVAVVIAIFAIGLARPKGKSGCGGGCDCAGNRPTSVPGSDETSVETGARREES